MSQPLDLSEMVSRARQQVNPRPAPGRVNATEMLRAALGHLPPKILLAWGQSLTDDAKAGMGYYGPLLGMMRAELESRPDVAGVAANG